MAQDRQIPTSWPEIRAELAALPGGSANTFLFFHGSLVDIPAAAPTLGADFFRAAAALVRGAVMERVDVVAGLLPLATERARAVASGRPIGWLPDLAALAVLCLEEAGGWRATEAEVTPILERLSAGPRQPVTAARQAIWAGLAYGRTGPIAPLMGEDLGAVPPDPDGRFDRAEWEAQRHLARCLATGAPLETALPAWRGYLESFPLHLGARAATWPELLWAARTVRVTLGGAAPESLLDWLRAEVAAAE